MCAGSDAEPIPGVAALRHVPDAQPRRDAIEMANASLLPAAEHVKSNNPPVLRLLLPQLIVQNIQRQFRQEPWQF
jgi:hypothetical protein